MEKTIRLEPLGIILSAGIITAALIGAFAFIDVKKAENVVSVSGSAKLKVTSDSARWTGSFSRTVLMTDLKNGYAMMKEDEKKTNDFFVKEGFAKEALEISPVFMNEVYKNNENAPKEYNLVQNVELKSSEVEKIKKTAKAAEKLAEQGIIFSSNAVEYYYSKLPEQRIALLPEAIKDAKKRADIIAQSSAKEVDAVQSVSMGVVQVMPVGAVEISDYGSYDTSSVDKEVMITVKTVFGLK